MNASYLFKDYNSLQNMIKEKWPHLQKNVDSKAAADTGTMISQLFCSIADMLAFYIDNQTNEAFLSSAKHPDNIFSLCRQLGYSPHGPIAATVSLNFSLEDPEDFQDQIKIPKGTICKSEDNIFFVTTLDGFITHKTDIVSIKAIQGKEVIKEICWNGNETYLKLKGNIAENSIKLSIDNTVWNKKLDFLESNANSKDFIIIYDYKGKAKIIFGDSFFGEKPKHNSKIRISYLETLSEKGNISPLAVNQICSQITLNNKPVKLTVINPEESSGGLGSEKPHSAIKNTKSLLKTAWCAVTKEDYENLAKTIPGVAIAHLIERKQYGHLELFIATKNIENNKAIIEKVKHFLNKRKTIATDLKILSAQYIKINIAATVYLWEDSILEESKKDIIQKLKSFFKIGKHKFESTINISDIIALVNNSPKVNHINLIHPSKNIAISENQLPICGDLNINFKCIGH